jgi:hypothetical protein
MRPAYRLLLATGLAFVLAQPAFAQAIRTWVSGVGDDANPCSRTAACKTFAGAISKTANGGEISCLEAGGFGSVMIMKSITIDCRGTPGSILVEGAAVSAGVTVSGTGAVVTLRNLSIQGAASATRGIRFVNGTALHVENVAITGFSGDPAVGIDFTPSSPATLFVTDTMVTNNGSGSGGAGINVAPNPGGSAVVNILSAKLHYNGRGMTLSSDNGAISAVLSGSSIASSFQDGILATGGNAISLTIDNTAVINNVGSAINAMAATVWIGRSLVVGNGAGVTGAPGSIGSFKNNQIAGNGGGGGAKLDAVPDGPLN